MAAPLAVLAAAVGGAAVSGCGGEDLAPEGVAQAADKTSRAATARVAVLTSLEMPGTPRPVRVAMNGEMDMRGGRGELEADFSDIASAAGPQAGDREDFQGRLAFEGTTLFMSLPALNKELPGDKEWIKVDLQEAARQQGLDPGLGTQFEDSDPTQTLRYLRATSGEVKEVGSERVRGVPATRYRATVDLRRYPRLVPAHEREQAERAVDRLIEKTGSPVMPTEVWIDQSKVVRRIAQRMSLEPLPGQRMTIRQRMDYFDFGADVDVDVPDPDEAVDALELAKRAPGGRGR